MVCGCIYPGESCGPTAADLESGTAGAEDRTPKLSAFGGTGIGSDEPCSGHVEQMPVGGGSALVQLLEHIFWLGLAQEAAGWESTARHGPRASGDESPQERSLAWSELNCS